MKRIFTAISFILIFLLHPFADPVNVEIDSPQMLRFTWEMNSYDTTRLNSEHGYVQLSFPSANMQIGDSAQPLLPGYSFYVGVPTGGSAKITFKADSLSRLILKEDLSPSDHRAHLAVNPLFSTSPWISDPQPTRFKEMEALRITIRPFLYDQNTRSITILHKGSCTVEFSESLNLPPPPKRMTDYERMLQSILINYKTAKGWRRENKTLRKVQSSAVDIFSKKTYSFKIGDGNRNFNEGTTLENGILKIDGTLIRSLFGNTVSLKNIALYASHKGELPLEMKDAEVKNSDVLKELPLLRVSRNSESPVQSDDYALAFVTGASDWRYDTVENRFRMQINRYDDYRTYWLTLKDTAGLTMQSFVQPQGGLEPRTHFENNYYLRRPLKRSQHYKEGGIDWVLASLDSSNSSFSQNVQLPNLDRSLPGKVSISTHFAKGSGYVSTFFGKELCSACNSSWHMVDSWNAHSIRFEYSGLRESSLHEVSGVHFRYFSEIAAKDSIVRLEMFSDTADAIPSYRLEKSTSKKVYIFRIPMNETAVSLIDTLKAGSQADYFTWTDSGGIGVRYFICSEDDFITMPEIKAVDKLAEPDDFFLTDLRNNNNNADYLIISHLDFKSAARRLAEHKLSMGFRTPRVVFIEDVYNQFSGGNTDPAALRNFLLYVYQSWNGGAELSYVVLFGSGHYDYKNIASSEINYMPTAQINGVCMDIFFVLLNPENQISSQHDPYYLLGRLPAKSIADADVMVDKIIESEKLPQADYGPWRNRVLLVADDDMQGTQKDRITDHHISSEAIYEVLKSKRPFLEIPKVYLYEYPWDEQKEKPEASRILINQINQGVLAVNWFGHGADDLWADEHILSKESVLKMHNSKRYPLITSFSCTVGKFDSPDREGLSSTLVKQSNAGAIATISATRETYPGPNTAIAKNIYSNLFSTTFPNSLGASFAKALSEYRNSNNRAYALLGDPSLKIGPVNRQISLSVLDEDGHSIDTLKALQKITIKGTVNFPDGSVDNNLDGSNVYLNLYNPSRPSSRKDGGTYTSPSYILPGALVLASSAQVVDGSFQQTVLLPQALIFDTPGVKLTSYSWQDSTIGAGSKTDLIFSGTIQRPIDDSTGPTISIRPIYEAEEMNRSGIFVTNRISSQLPLRLEVLVQDQNGIDVTGTGPSEGLTIEVKKALAKRSINHLFQFENGDYRKGMAILQFEPTMLKPGLHELEIISRDLLGNISKQTVKVEILEDQVIKFDHVLNIPNPTRMGQGTRFFFHHSDPINTMALETTVKLYTLGGKLIRVIRNANNGELWDDRDQRGNILPPNVYLYQITAYSPFTKKSEKSKIKKLVVHPPR